MSASVDREDEPRGVRAGLSVGFAAPLFFLGALPRYEGVRSDNVSQSWREVGKTLDATMKRERAKLRDAGR